MKRPRIVAPVLFIAVATCSISCTSPLDAVKRNETVTEQDYVQKGPYHVYGAWVSDRDAMDAGWQLDGDVEKATAANAFIAAFVFYADSREELPKVEYTQDFHTNIVSVKVNGTTMRDAGSEDYLLVLNNGHQDDLVVKQASARELAELYYEFTRGDGFPPQKAD